MSTLDLYAYTSWRAYVRDWLELTPRWHRSRLARELGCAPGHITNILHPDAERQRNLTESYLDVLIDALALPDSQARFFRHLVAYEQSPEGSTQREEAWGAMQATLRYRGASHLPPDNYDFFAKWELSAILELANHRAFTPDPDWIRAQLIPEVDRETVVDALALLIRLELLKEGPDGRLRAVHGVLADPGANGTQTRELRAAMRDAGKARQRGLMEHAERGLDAFTDRERFYTNGAALVPESMLHELRQSIWQFQQDWMERVERHRAESGVSEPARVYQLNMQLFPSTTWLPGVDEEEE